jgi:hypothetical protein
MKDMLTIVNRVKELADEHHRNPQVSAVSKASRDDIDCLERRARLRAEANEVVIAFYRLLAENVPEGKTVGEHFTAPEMFQKFAIVYQRASASFRRNIEKGLPVAD